MAARVVSTDTSRLLWAPSLRSSTHSSTRVTLLRRLHRNTRSTTRNTRSRVNNMATLSSQTSALVRPTVPPIKEGAIVVEAGCTSPTPNLGGAIA